MKVKKIVDLDRDGINITEMFRRKLAETCPEHSQAYENNMNAFQEMLQEVADKAFRLGQKNPD